MIFLWLEFNTLCDPTSNIIKYYISWICRLNWDCLLYSPTKVTFTLPMYFIWKQDGLQAIHIPLVPLIVGSFVFNSNFPWKSTYTKKNISLTPCGKLLATWLSLCSELFQTSKKKKKATIDSPSVKTALFCKMKCVLTYRGDILLINWIKKKLTV